MSRIKGQSSEAHPRPWIFQATDLREESGRLTQEGKYLKKLYVWERSPSRSGSQRFSLKKFATGADFLMNKK